MQIDHMSTDKIWVYDDPHECYDTATLIHENVGGKVTSIEDAFRRCVGFEMSNGTRVLYYITGQHGPVGTLLIRKESRDCLAECIETRIGPLGVAQGLPSYMEDY